MDNIPSYIFLGFALAAVLYLVFFTLRLSIAIAKRGSKGTKPEKNRQTKAVEQMNNMPKKIPTPQKTVAQNVPPAQRPVQNTMQTKPLDVTVDSPLDVTVELPNPNDGIEHIQLGFSSIIGTRKSQQDAVLVSDKAFLQNNSFKRGIAVLCDGMGGLSGGELASSITVKTIYDDFVAMQPKNIPDFLRAEVRKTDDIVYNLRDESGKLLGAGSTLVSVVLDNNKLYWVSVGDSRIYIIRSGEMVQVTQDHNYYMILKHRADNGMITQEEARNDPKAEALISFIGIGKSSPIDINDQPFVLQNGDMILLCSDGLYKTLPNQAIAKILLQNSQNPTVAAAALTQAVMAENRRGQDNTTVAVIKYFQ